MIPGSGGLRTQLARLTMAAGFVCGVLGLVAGAQDVVWKFGSTGWFTGGSLLVLLAIFELIDGAVARMRYDSLAIPAPFGDEEDQGKPVWRPPSPPR